MGVVGPKRGVLRRQKSWVEQTEAVISNILSTKVESYHVL